MNNLSATGGLKGGLNFNIKETSKINVFKHSLLNGRL